MKVEEDENNQIIKVNPPTAKKETPGVVDTPNKTDNWLINAIFMIIKIVLTSCQSFLQRKGYLLCPYSQKFTEIFSADQINSWFLAQEHAKSAWFSIFVPIFNGLAHVLPFSYPEIQD